MKHVFPKFDNPHRPAWALSLEPPSKDPKLYLVLMGAAAADVDDDADELLMEAPGVVSLRSTAPVEVALSLVETASLLVVLKVEVKTAFRGHVPSAFFFSMMMTCSE